MPQYRAHRHTHWILVSSKLRKIVERSETRSKSGRQSVESQLRKTRANIFRMTCMRINLAGEVIEQGPAVCQAACTRMRKEPNG